MSFASKSSKFYKLKFSVCKICSLKDLYTLSWRPNSFRSWIRKFYMILWSKKKKFFISENRYRLWNSSKQCHTCQSLVMRGVMSFNAALICEATIFTGGNNSGCFLFSPIQKNCMKTRVDIWTSLTTLSAKTWFMQSTASFFSSVVRVNFILICLQRISILSKITFQWLRNF